MTSGFGTSAINPHPSTMRTQASKSTGVRLLQVVMLWARIPHTHPACFTPNQHTPTCRSINGLVSKRPAYPQIEDVLGNKPFPSPIERAYLELYHTARCGVEPLFRNPFFARDHLLGPQHIRTTGGCIAVDISFSTKGRCVLKL